MNRKLTNTCKDRTVTIVVKGTNVERMVQTPYKPTYSQGKVANRYLGECVRCIENCVLGFISQLFYLYDAIQEFVKLIFHKLMFSYMVLI